MMRKPRIKFFERGTVTDTYTGRSGIGYARDGAPSGAFLQDREDCRRIAREAGAVAVFVRI